MIHSSTLWSLVRDILKKGIFLFYYGNPQPYVEVGGGGGFTARRPRAVVQARSMIFGH